jgi:hypothetical protein
MRLAGVGKGRLFEDMFVASLHAVFRHQATKQIWAERTPCVEQVTIRKETMDVMGGRRNIVGI